jgi:hypothetical protein
MKNKKHIIIKMLINPKVREMPVLLGKVVFKKNFLSRLTS